MKNIKIRMITFHSPKNYGAVLQAFSLMSYLQNYSDDVQIIDFNTPHLRSLYPLIKKPNSLKSLLLALLNAVYVCRKRIKYKKFDCFVAEQMNLTKRYESLEALRLDPPAADHYFTGSDQVFNPNRIAEERSAFFLDFGKESVVRSAYAASFGTHSVSDEVFSELSRYLDHFRNISVREKSGSDLLNVRFNIKAVEVMDPVFLYDSTFWREKARPYPVGDAPYLLYYRLMGAPDGDDDVRRLAKKKNLRLIVVTDGFLKWRADKILRDVGPCEFLSLYDKAQYVATDSFHGVAFALVFEKQFVFTDRNPILADRAMNLMEKIGVLSCASLNGNTGDAVIDYETVRPKLDCMIRDSKQFIENVLMTG